MAKVPAETGANDPTGTPGVRADSSLVTISSLSTTAGPDVELAAV